MKYELVVYQYDVESNHLLYSHSYECESMTDMARVINTMFEVELRTTYLKMEAKEIKDEK